MKIIKKGEDWCAPTFSEVMVDCNRCGSKLEIEAEDVKEEVNSGVQGMFFECPVCFEHNRLTGDISVRYWNWVEYKTKTKEREK